MLVMSRIPSCADCPSRTRRVERLSLLWRAHVYHRDLRTRLPAAAVASPGDRARQFMTVTPLSPSPITASVRRRYLTGTGHASQTATVSTAFGRQNLEHQIPDHCADRIQGGQDQRPAGPSTVVLSGTDKSDPAAAPNSPQIDTSVGANSPRGFLPRGFSDACLRAPPRAWVWQASENP